MVWWPILNVIGSDDEDDREVLINFCMLNILHVLPWNKIKATP